MLWELWGAGGGQERWWVGEGGVWTDRKPSLAMPTSAGNTFACSARLRAEGSCVGCPLPQARDDF